MRRGRYSIDCSSACKAGLKETRLFLPVFCAPGFLDRVSGLLETKARFCIEVIAGQ
jgi:hypothetical protein